MGAFAATSRSKNAVARRTITKVRWISIPPFTNKIESPRIITKGRHNVSESRQWRDCTIQYEVGFCNVFIERSAGEHASTRLMGEKPSSYPPKVLNHRPHRIKDIPTGGKDYQVIFSDTPGIIEPRYKLHEKMMQAVKIHWKITDLALLMLIDQSHTGITGKGTIRIVHRRYGYSHRAIVVLNKIDGAKAGGDRTDQNILRGQNLLSEGGGDLGIEENPCQRSAGGGAQTDAGRAAFFRRR